MLSDARLTNTDDLVGVEHLYVLIRVRAYARRRVTNLPPTPRFENFRQRRVYTYDRH